MIAFSILKDLGGFTHRKRLRILFLVSKIIKDKYMRLCLVLLSLLIVLNIYAQKINNNINKQIQEVSKEASKTSVEQEHLRYKISEQETRAREAGSSAKIVSWYGVKDTCWYWTDQGLPCKTADGTIFTGQAGVVACVDSVRLGTRFRIRYGKNELIAVCRDRGNFEHLGRYLDLSEDSFKQLEPDLSKGLIEVEIEEI